MSTCGECHFGKLMPQDFKARACLGAPPVPVGFPVKNGIQVKMMRPVVMATDEACALFKPRTVIELAQALPKGAHVESVKSNGG